MVTNLSTETLDQKYLLSDIKEFWNFNNSLGLKKLLYGIDYQRCLEYPVAFNQLKVNDNVSTYLDIGTGKYSIFPLYVSFRCHNLSTRMTDINSHVFKQLKAINHNNVLKDLYNNSKITIEKQDARALTYEDDSFERITAISSIEHIPEDGDTQAVKEIVRVLKPDGRAVITLPYRDSGYLARYKKQSVANEEKGIKPEFFSHYYDQKALYERIIDHDNFELESIIYLGEDKFPYFEFWTTKVPIRNTLKYMFGWINPFMALKYYITLPETEKSKAHVAVITLLKR